MWSFPVGLLTWAICCMKSFDPFWTKSWLVICNCKSIFRTVQPPCNSLSLKGATHKNFVQNFKKLTKIISRVWRNNGVVLSFFRSFLLTEIVSLKIEGVHFVKILSPSIRPVVSGLTGCKNCNCSELSYHLTCLDSHKGLELPHLLKMTEYLRAFLQH